MLFRYGTTGNGNIEKKAHIYTEAEHGIDVRQVDPDALWVVRRLRGARFHAYIVGGAVRDLLVGRTPKDFDVATDAHPQQIKRLFRSARVIGRRFRLVHVYCSREKYIEVSTFRSRSAIGVADERSLHADGVNLFGTMEEDAARRDFTINALYYCPVDRQLIDYVDGLPDLRQRRLRTLVRAESSFAEDPVRMIRAMKYACLLGFPFPLALAGLVRRMRESVLSCSRERVTEEVFKILTSGSAAGIVELSHRLRLFEIVFPAHARNLHESRTKLSDSKLGARLRELDARAAEGILLDRNEMFGFLFSDLAMERTDIIQGEEPHFLLEQYIRAASAPLFPSKKDLAVAAETLLKTARPRPEPRRAQPGTPARKRRRRRGGHRGGALSGSPPPAG